MPKTFIFSNVEFYIFKLNVLFEVVRVFGQGMLGDKIYFSINLMLYYPSANGSFTISNIWAPVQIMNFINAQVTLIEWIGIWVVDMGLKTYEMTF